MLLTIQVTPALLARRHEGFLAKQACIRREFRLHFTLFNRRVSKCSKLPADAGFLREEALTLGDKIKWTTKL